MTLRDVLRKINERWRFLDENPELLDPAMISDEQVRFLLALEKKYGALTGKLWGLTEEEFRTARNISVEQRFRKDNRN